MFSIPKPAKERQLQGKQILPLSSSSRVSIKTATTAASSLLQDEDDLFDLENSFANISTDWACFETHNDDDANSNEVSLVHNRRDGGGKAQKQKSFKTNLDSRHCRKKIVNDAINIALHPHGTESSIEEQQEHKNFEFDDDHINSVTCKKSDKSQHLFHDFAANASFLDISFDNEWEAFDESQEQFNKGEEEGEEREEHGVGHDYHEREEKRRSRSPKDRSRSNRRCRDSKRRSRSRSRSHSRNRHGRSRSRSRHGRSRHGRRDGRSHTRSQSQSHRSSRDHQNQSRSYRSSRDQQKNSRSHRSSHSQRRRSFQDYQGHKASGSGSMLSDTVKAILENDVSTVKKERKSSEQKPRRNGSTSSLLHTSHHSPKRNINQNIRKPKSCNDLSKLSSLATSNESKKKSTSLRNYIKRPQAKKNTDMELNAWQLHEAKKHQKFTRPVGARQRRRSNTAISSRSLGLSISDLNTGIIEGIYSKDGSIKVKDKSSDENDDNSSGNYDSSCHQITSRCEADDPTNRGDVGSTTALMQCEQRRNYGSVLPPPPSFSMNSPSKEEVGTSASRPASLSVQQRRDGTKYLANHSKVIEERLDSKMRRSHVRACMEKYSIP